MKKKQTKRRKEKGKRLDKNVSSNDYTGINSDKYREDRKKYVFKKEQGRKEKEKGLGMKKLNDNIGINSGEIEMVRGDHFFKKKQSKERGNGNRSDENLGRSRRIIDLKTKERIQEKRYNNYKKKKKKKKKVREWDKGRKTLRNGFLEGPREND